MKRLDALVDQFELPGAARRQLGILLRELAQKHAPTAVRDPVAAVDLHIADSLVALGVPETRAASSLADLGAGAGVPALVLAAALPDTRVTAVESVARKAQFVAATAEAMGLVNVDVFAGRAEEWTAGLGAADVVTARALATLSVLAEYAAPLLREGGLLVAWKGAPESKEIADARFAAAELGLSEPEAMAVRPFRASERRTLYLLRKVRPTPAKYPRRSGMATKRPLTAKT